MWVPGREGAKELAQTGMEDGLAAVRATRRGLVPPGIAATAFPPGDGIGQFQLREFNVISEQSSVNNFFTDH